MTASAMQAPCKATAKPAMRAAAKRAAKSATRAAPKPRRRAAAPAPAACDRCGAPPVSKAGLIRGACLPCLLEEVGVLPGHGEARPDSWAPSDPDFHRLEDLADELAAKVHAWRDRPRELLKMSADHWLVIDDGGGHSADSVPDALLLAVFIREVAAMRAAARVRLAREAFRLVKRGGIG